MEESPTDSAPQPLESDETVVRNEAPIEGEAPVAEEEVAADKAEEQDSEEDALRAAVHAILGSVDPEQATYRQIRERIESEHHLSTEGRKELILTLIEKFFATESDAEQDNDEQEREEEEEEEETKTRNTKAKSKGGFAAPVVLSYELAEFMGTNVMPRTEVTKRLWAYIKEHKLQNPKNGREILCDEKLQAVLKRKKVMMFGMTKIVAGLMKSANELQANCLSDDDEEEEEEEDEDNEEEEEEEKEEKKPVAKSKRPAAAKSAASNTKAKSTASSSSSKRSRKKEEESANEEDEEEEENEEEEQSKSAKRRRKSTEVVKKSTVYKLVDGESQEFTRTTTTKKEKNEGEKKKSAGFDSKGCYVNPTLVELLKLEDGPQKRSEVVSKLWEYIRSNELQNPKDKREILLNDPLQKLLGVKKCTMFSINKYLKPHIKSLEG